jgi:hypothetical protein
MPERSQLSRPLILPQYLKTSSYDVDELKIIQGTDNIETRKKIKRFKIVAIESVSRSNQFRRIDADCKKVIIFLSRLIFL